MKNSSDNRIAGMIELLNQKSRLLQDMLFITKEQSSAICEKNLDGLERLIASKQAKIDKIDEIDMEFETNLEEYKKSMNVKNLDELQGKGIIELQDLKRATGEVMKLVDEIMKLEKANGKNAKALMNEIESKIRNISQGKKAQLAYYPALNNASSYFIDRKK